MDRFLSTAKYNTESKTVVIPPFVIINYCFDTCDFFCYLSSAYHGNIPASYALGAPADATNLLVFADLSGLGLVSLCMSLGYLEFDGIR